MRIGQDVSIQTCRDEGYMVMDYPVYKFKANPRTTDCRFTRSLPFYIRQEMCMQVTESIIHLDAYLSWGELMEMYQQHKEGVDSMIGGTYQYIDDPEPYQVLNLAADLDMYCGLK